jgi:hypothetical protein
MSLASFASLFIVIALRQELRATIANCSLLIHTCAANISKLKFDFLLERDIHEKNSRFQHFTSNFKKSKEEAC